MKKTAIILAAALALPFTASAQTPAKKKAKPEAGPVVAEAQVASGNRAPRTGVVVVLLTGKPVVSNP